VALGLRLRQATDADIEKAYNAGEVLRTHVMRPTWHFLVPRISAPCRRLPRQGSGRQRHHAAQAGTGHEAPVALSPGARDALGGGRHLTRSELSACLAGSGSGPPGRGSPTS